MPRVSDDKFLIASLLSPILSVSSAALDIANFKGSPLNLPLFISSVNCLNSFFADMVLSFKSVVVLANLAISPLAFKYPSADLSIVALPSLASFINVLNVSEFLKVAEVSPIMDVEAVLAALLTDWSNILPTSFADLPLTSKSFITFFRLSSVDVSSFCNVSNDLLAELIESPSPLPDFEASVTLF